MISEKDIMEVDEVKDLPYAISPRTITVKSSCTMRRWKAYAKAIWKMVLVKKGALRFEKKLGAVCR
jgi:hypothetical protein